MSEWIVKTHMEWEHARERRKKIIEMENAAQESHETREKAQKEIKSLQAEIKSLQDKINLTRQEVGKVKKEEEKLFSKCESAKQSIQKHKNEKSKEEKELHNLKLKIAEKGVPIINADHFVEFFERYHRVQDAFASQKRQVGGAEHFRQAFLLHIKETSQSLLDKKRDESLKIRKRVMTGYGTIDPLDYIKI